MSSVQKISEPRFRTGSDKLQVINLSHHTQVDSPNCGVLTCWYAKQIIEKQSLTTTVVINIFTFEIFITLVG